jgi:hypothetical protein
MSWGRRHEHGFVVESHEGSPVAIRVVKIDAGEAFGWDAAHNQFIQHFSLLYEGEKLADPKDLQFGNMQPKVILRGKLLEPQKQRFLATLNRGVEALPNERLLDFLMHRRGALDETVPGRTLLREDMVTKFKKSWRSYMKNQRLPAVYGTELAGLLPAAAEIGADSAPFDPKAGGTASCTFEEALALSQAP